MGQRPGAADRREQSTRGRDGFHAVTIDHDTQRRANAECVRTATKACLELADVLGIRVIAFPALGTDHLRGETGLELVTLALFTRRGVEQSALNVFYERAAALASIGTQSGKLAAVLTELRRLVEASHQPDVAARIAQLELDLKRAGAVLAESPRSLGDFDRLHETSHIAAISEAVVGISTEAAGWSMRFKT